jgi:hypothetical protein
MRWKFAVALAACAASFTGCYRSMYAPPYGYSPGYGGYPGPINTLTPGQQYVPGGAIPPGGTYVQPYTGGDAAPYNPTVVPGNNSASRPAPTYGDPGADTSGGREMGALESAPVLQRTGSQTFASPEPVPLGTATSVGNDFVTPAASASNAFGDTQVPLDATAQKPVLPQIPITYRPFSTSPPPLRRTPAY